jgi:hypothetical protein
MISLVDKLRLGTKYSTGIGIVEELKEVERICAYLAKLLNIEIDENTKPSDILHLLAEILSPQPQETVCEPSELTPVKPAV